MKIEGVKFKNISALKGEWEIRFDQPPLADTGLFAIVGPNGSGKTSILDALTLALYGETPRLKDPALAVMNWQAADAYAEVTFSVGGSVYRSHWSVHNRTAKLEAPAMVLVSLNGQETILEDRVIKVRNRIAELTGLDFKRFCRSILLAQGEFTAFLNALENERAEILEKIIGPELARELEESTRTRAEAENERLIQLKEAVGNLPLLDKDQLKALLETFQRAEEELWESEQLVEELRVAKDWRERVDLLESQHIDATDALAAAEARHTQLQADLRRLEEAQRAVPFQADVIRLNELQQEADRLKALLSYLEIDIQSFQDQIAQLEERLLQNRLALDQAQSQLEERGADIRNALHLDREIAEESERFQQAVARYEALERSQKEALQQQSDVETQITEVKNRLQELQRWAEEHGTDARLEVDIPVLEKIRSGLQTIRRQMGEHQAQETEILKGERRAARVLRRAERATQKVHGRTEKLTARKKERERRLEELLGTDTLESLVTGYRERKHRLAACEKLIKIERKYQKRALGEDIPSVLAGISSQQDTLTQSLALEQNRLAELEESGGWRAHLKKYTPDRPSLQPGKPCPLCGALDHPFAEQGLPDFAVQDKVLQDQREKVKALQSELKTLGSKAAELQARAKALETINQAWTKECAQAGGEWDIANPASLQQEFHTDKTEVKLTKSRIRSVRWHKWRASRVEKALLGKLEKLTRKAQARDLLHNTHELQVEAVAQVKSELDRLGQNQQTAVEELSFRLQELGESLSGPDMEADLMQRFKQRWDVYHRQRRERELAMDRLHSLEARREALPQELAQLQTEAETLGAELETNQQRLYVLRSEREGLTGTMDPAQEKQSLENEIALRSTEKVSLNKELKLIRQDFLEKQSAHPMATEQAREAQNDADEAEQEILPRALAAGFGSIDAISDLLRLLERQETIMEQSDAAVQTLAEARLRTEAARSALDSTRSERVVGEPLESLRGKLAVASKRHELLQEEIQTAELRLEQQREVELDNREVLQAVAEQEKICARAMAGRRVLQSHDPVEIQRKLQRLMLERLLDQANQHLEMLNGRYTLRPLAEEGLGLQVEDALQGGVGRSAKTLSGGESFLVSLCLALGLSEMASKDRKIESLFLDEGFGTLDDETLYKVMVALKGLRANGKMVGIISHVKRLADEIPTQIRVEKQPGGFSRIHIVA
jgi:exonuclease SbcC